jgi:hypothetical protein
MSEMGVVMKTNVLAFLCALVGGALGYFAFFWAAGQGFYALMLPGGLLGFGAGIVSNRSLYVPFVCGLLATALGIIAEYRFAPFNADDSLPFFLSHLFDLKPITLFMIAAGGLIGFWVPYRRTERHDRLSAASKWQRSRA